MLFRCFTVIIYILSLSSGTLTEPRLSITDTSPYIGKGPK